MKPRCPRCPRHQGDIDVRYVGTDTTIDGDTVDEYRCRNGHLFTEIPDGH